MKRKSDKFVNLDFESMTKEQLRKHKYYKDIMDCKKSCFNKEDLILALEDVAREREEATNYRCRVEYRKRKGCPPDKYTYQNRLWTPRERSKNTCTEEPFKGALVNRFYATVRIPNACKLCLYPDKMTGHPLFDKAPDRDTEYAQYMMNTNDIIRKKHFNRL
jgi:hypothetical protein